MSATQGSAPGELQPFYTPKTLARRLAVSDRSMRRMLSEGTIPSYRVAGSRRVDPADVEEYLRQHRDG
jgi:excisionase family DNA binding protein